MKAKSKSQFAKRVGVFTLRDLRELVESCAKARIKRIKWEGVELIFEGFEEPKETRQESLVAQDAASAEALKKDIEAFEKDQQEFEKELAVVTDPLAWEKEMSGHGEE